MDMFFDFSFYLLLALVVAVCLMVGWRVIQRLRPERPTPKLVLFAREFFVLILVVFILRTFVIEPFRIPSGSMLPNLQDGDLILVTKYNYGLRVPVTNSVIIPTGHPQRGDPVVFFHPQKTDLHYIKRIIGLPGDNILIQHNQVWIDGEPLLLDGIGADRLTLSDADLVDRLEQGYPEFDLRLETNGENRWLTMIDSDYFNTRQNFSVPEGHYFVLGDNRNRSNDSRYWGFVPERNLKGKAQLIWLHLDWKFWSRVGAIDPF